MSTWDQIHILAITFAGLAVAYLVGYAAGQDDERHDIDDCVLEAVAHFNRSGPDATPIGDAIQRKMGVEL